MKKLAKETVFYLKTSASLMVSCKRSMGNTFSLVISENEHWKTISNGTRTGNEAKQICLISLVMLWLRKMDMAGKKTQLLLIEGDSARGIAERIQQTNPAKFGVFPVTGKLNNANGKPKL